MKQETNFSKGERGKFYRKDAELHLPIYLDHDVLTYVRERAKSEGIEMNQLVNDMLKHEIALAKGVTPER